MERPGRIRHAIFILVAATTAIFLYLPFSIETPADPEVERYFEAIEGLERGDVVALSTEYSPATEAELGNMHENTLYHLFARGVKVIHFSTWEYGPDIASRFVDRVKGLVREDHGIEPALDVDYTELSYTSGKEIAMINAATSIPATFPRTRQGRPSKDCPIMRGVAGLAPDPATGERGVKLLVDFASGNPGTREWLRTVGKRYGVRIIAGVTSVMAPDLYPFMQSGQLEGLLNGLPAGYQYEQLLRRAGIRKSPSQIDADMSIQSAMHLLIIGLVVIGNIAYAAGRARRRA